MTPDQLSDLHRQASAWFEEHGLYDEALHHALAAGDLDLAARQMSDGLRDVINREDRPTLERWLSLLPEEMIQQRPGLLMIRVWALQFTWRLDLQAQVLQQVEELLETGAGALMQENDLQILHAQVDPAESSAGVFRQPAHPGHRALPAGTGAPAASLDVRARRSDALPGYIDAGQRSIPGG